MLCTKTKGNLHFCIATGFGGGVADCSQVGAVLTQAKHLSDPSVTAQAACEIVTKGDPRQVLSVRCSFGHCPPVVTVF